MTGNGLPDHDLVLAHEHCTKNRAELMVSEICGCFYCLAVFAPAEIVSWIDKRNAPLQSALCPKCGIDSVIGSRSGYPITIDFMRRMHQRWFETQK